MRVWLLALLVFGSMTAEGWMYEKGKGPEKEPGREQPEAPCKPQIEEGCR
jgi:hypothetical protein